MNSIRFGTLVLSGSVTQLPVGQCAKLIRRLAIFCALISLIQGIAIEQTALAANTPSPSCKAIRAANPSAVDGEYQLSVSAGTFQVYCADMLSGAPKEYLTLKRTGSEYNFSRYGHTNATLSDVTAKYTRLRLDPATLRVDTKDKRFATISGGPNVHYPGGLPYATAEDCLGTNSATGQANIDLSGTPFEVDASFAVAGWYPAGSANGLAKSGPTGGLPNEVHLIPVSGQVINLAGGGHCGQIAPWISSTDSGLQLKLVSALAADNADHYRPQIASIGDQNYTREALSNQLASNGLAMASTSPGNTTILKANQCALTWSDSSESTSESFGLFSCARAISGGLELGVRTVKGKCLNNNSDCNATRLAVDLGNGSAYSLDINPEYQDPCTGCNVPEVFAVGNSISLTDAAGDGFGFFPDNGSAIQDPAALTEGLFSANPAHGLVIKISSDYPQTGKVIYRLGKDALVIANRKAIIAGDAVMAVLESDWLGASEVILSGANQVFASMYGNPLREKDIYHSYNGAYWNQGFNSIGVQFNVKLWSDSMAIVTGEFVPMPSCDSFWDGVEDIAGSIARGVNDLAMEHINNNLNLVSGLAGNLLSGDLEGMADQVIDYSNAQMLAQFNQVMLPVSLGIDVLPNGVVTNFLRDAESLTRQLAPAVIQMANPANTVKGDAGEIGGDFATLFESLADPADFPKAYFELHQKWNPLYSTTYLFTEGDPMKGAEKAAERLLRQVEIVTTYVTPFAGLKFAAKYPKLYKFAQAIGVGKGSKQVLKNLVKRSIKEGEARHAAEAFLRNLTLSKSSTLVVNTAIARTFALVDQGMAESHPLYTSTEIRNVPAERIATLGSPLGGTQMTLWRPRVEATNCIALGDYANTMSPFSGERIETLPALCGVDAQIDHWWSRPEDYKLVWGDNCSGNDEDMSIWMPVCEVGYSPVGFVGGGWAGQKPSRDRVACLSDDPGVFKWANGNTAGLKPSADDEGSGAKFDVTIYNRYFAGMPLMYATAQYPPNHEAFLADLDVPMAGGGVPYAADVTLPKACTDVIDGKLNWYRSHQPNAGCASQIQWAIRDSITGNYCPLAAPDTDPSRASGQLPYKAIAGKVCSG